MSEKEIYSGPNFRYRPDKNNFTEKKVPSSSIMKVDS